MDSPKMTYDEWLQKLDRAYPLTDFRLTTPHRVCVICRQIKDFKHFEGSVGRCIQCFLKHTPNEAQQRMRRAVGLKEHETGDEGVTIHTKLRPETDYHVLYTCPKEVKKKS